MDKDRCLSRFALRTSNMEEGLASLAAIEATCCILRGWWIQGGKSLSLTFEFEGSGRHRSSDRDR